MAQQIMNDNPSQTAKVVASDTDSELYTAERLEEIVLGSASKQRVKAFVSKCATELK